MRIFEVRSTKCNYELKRCGTAICFAIAKDWTEEFEKKNKNRHWEDDLEEEVRKFVQQKIKNLKQ